VKSISILIVEDNQDKRRRIVEAIEAANIAVTCDVAETVIDAKRFVSNKQYDLLILDLSLPNYPGEVELEDAGANFLREVQDYELYIAPKYVIGVTAFSELSTKYEESFARRFWQVLQSDPASASWSQQISSFVQHLSRMFSQDQQQSVVDVVVMTALSDEYEKVLDLPFNWSAPIELDEQIYYQLGSVSSEGRSISVAAICALRMGPVPAATLACKAMAHLRPRIIGMTGICAGIKGSANLGDVVAATEVFSWESGKLIGDTHEPFQPEPVSVTVSDSVLAKFQRIQSDRAWLDEVRRDYGRGAPASSLEVIMGPMATGSPVVSDADVVERIRKINRKTIGIEMEAYGALFAARSWRTSPPLAFCLKAVSDFASKDKDDSVRDYAAYVSARVFGELLKRYGSALLPLR
jgi:nucleoside phosphorylase/CheY-like chemotaxis protein